MGCCHHPAGVQRWHQVCECDNLRTKLLMSFKLIPLVHLLGGCFIAFCRATTGSLVHSDLSYLLSCFKQSMSSKALWVVLVCFYEMILKPSFCMQNYVNLCSQVRCHNGGSCSQTATSWTCHCQPGWTGRYCDVPNQSCQDFAARKGEEVFFWQRYQEW